MVKEVIRLFGIGLSIACRTELSSSLSYKDGIAPGGCSSSSISFHISRDTPNSEILLKPSIMFNSASDCAVRIPMWVGPIANQNKTRESGS